MSGQGLDYEYELGNGWDQWQKLVLTEMRRLADASEEQGKKLDAAILDAAVSRAAFDELKRRFDEDKDDADKVHEKQEERVDKLDERVRALESNRDEATGISKYKQWIIPLAATIIINLVTWWLFISSSHPSPHLPSAG